MSELPAAVGWLVRMALGGGLLLLLTGLAVRRVRQPARQQRLAEWGVAAALLLAVLCMAPSWLLIPVSPARPPTRGLTPPARPTTGELTPPARPNIEELTPPAPPLRELTPPARREDTGELTPPTCLEVATLATGLVSLYLVAAGILLGRLGWGYWRLARCLRGAWPAPRAVRRLYEAMGPGPRTRLLVSRRLRVPLSCGLLRPTVVLPAALCEPQSTTQLRWVLAHERAHLRRRDAIGCLLFGLSAAVYYFVPWFWRLRRQARLCQEYVADAAAVAEAGAPEDYAEFLLSWRAAPAVPSGATGVSGHSSDLFRRIAMLVKNPFAVEEHCPRRWSHLAGAVLLCVAIVAAGAGLQAVRADTTKDNVKKDKKDAGKPGDVEKNGDRPLLPGFPDVDNLLKQFPQGMHEAHRKQIEEHLKQVHKMMEQMRQQVPGGGFPGVPGFPGGLPQFPQLPGAMLPQFPRLPLPFPQLPGGFPALGGLNRFNRQHDGRLGVRVEQPSAALADQLDLPRGQGLLVEDVLNDSAAARAGLKAHDILLEIDGKPVPSDPNDFARLLKDIKPNTPVDAVVLRKTRKETVKGLNLPKGQEARAGFRFPNDPFGNGGLGGLRGFRGVGGLAGSTTLNRTNDAFTARNTQGNLVVTVTGKVVDGKPQASAIEVQDGDNKTTKYDSVAKVPAQYRETVKKLLDATGGTGRFGGLRLR